MRLGEIANRLLDGVSLRLGLAVALAKLAGGNSRHDKVDEVGNVLGQRVFIRTNVVAACGNVVVDVVLRLEHRLELADSSLEAEPALAVGQANLVGRDAGLDEPALDRADGLFAGREHVGDLLLSVVLAVLGGLGIGAV